MKTIYLATIAFVLATLNTQACPEDIAVGNPINYAHLMKEQIDSDWDFFNVKTEIQARSMRVQIDAGTGDEIHWISYVMEDSNLPTRMYLYMVEIVYDATTKVLKEVRKFQRKRITGVNTNIQEENLFFYGYLTAVAPDTDAFLATAALNGLTDTCCQEKLEYIYFYYLFTNYFKDGRGSVGWATCPPN